MNSYNRLADEGENDPSSYTERSIYDYLRRLGARAAKRITRPALRRMRQCVNHIEVHDGLDMRPLDVATMLNHPLQEIRAMLRDVSAPGDLFRAVAPMEVAVPRSKRENIMRAVVAPLTAHGHTMAERWATNDAAIGIADVIAERAIAALEPIRGSFTRFVRSTTSFRWIVATDFAINSAGRPNDVFTYTVYPTSDANLIQRNSAALPRDYKDTRGRLSDTGLAYLARRDFFTFAFMPTRRRKIVEDLDSARKAIDGSIEALRQLRDAERFESEIRQWKALRQEANAKAFRFRHFENIVLAAIFAGVVATLLCAEGRAERIVWVPDRDAIADAYDGILWEMFSENAWAFTLRRRLPPAQIGYGVQQPATLAPGEAPWFDPIIRIPDFIAGVLSGWDFAGERTLANPKRDRTLLHQVVADNPNLAIVTYPALIPGDIQSALLQVSRQPIHISPGM